MTIKTRTRDRGGLVAPGGTAPIHATEHMSENRSRLPNGNLLCRNVPVARAGWLIYGPGEVPVKPGPNGVAYVERTADALFTEETIGSIFGAAATDDHPADDVTPVNWNQLSGGYAINVRRGTDHDHDVVLADLMITNNGLISAIEKGKVEVSLGYDADYLDLGGGIGKQFNIVANHIAFVDKGRCGPRCAVGDTAFQPPPTEGRQMPTQRVQIRGAARRTVDTNALATAARQRVADAQAELEALGVDEEGDTDTHIHIHADPANTGAPTRDAAIVELDTRVTGIEDNVAEILTILQGKTTDAAAVAAAAALASPTNDKEYDDDDESDEAEAFRKKRDAAKTKDNAAVVVVAGSGDSAALHTAYTGMLAQAEILVPGFKVPTFDAAASRAKTVDRMCATRRKVLDTIYGTPDGKLLVEGVNGGLPFDCVGTDCGAVATLFKAAAAAKGTANNTTATRDSKSVALPLDVQVVKGAPTPAEINAANTAFWAKQQGGVTK